MSSQEFPICVIEDNKGIRKMFCILLNKAGFKTVEFVDGNSALEWLSSNQAIGILADILLPDMNGTEILTAVRQLKNGDNITVIAVTGFALSSDKDKYLKMGFDGYISKPVDTHTFAEQVKEIMDKKSNPFL
jgi:CheY-like chemotaxis protein